MKFLRKKDVREKTTLSYSSIDRLEAAGRFPPRRRLGQLRVYWLEEEVEKWMLDQLEKRRRA